MKYLECKSCGASLVIDPSGTNAHCPYCRSRYVLDHSDTDYYRDFYERMRGFFGLSKDGQDRRIRAEELWSSADESVFECSNGRRIDVKSLYKYQDRDAEVYTARQNVIIRFTPENAANADRFRRAVSSLDYPSADTKSLSDFFPTIGGGFKLSDGSALLAVKKSEDEYPLRLFGVLGARHAAWIVSRLENLCCVLEYNSLAHPSLGLDDIYIDPYDHTASLYGGWQSVVRNNTSVGGKVCTTRDNLIALRTIAAQVLGFEDAASVRATDDLPEPFAAFLSGAPESNAYDDFARWDDVLMKSFGERRFMTMDTDDEHIYGKR